MLSQDTLIQVLYFVPPLIVAVVVHEVAHGFIAEKLGDPTARLAKRIRLNPLVHVDLFMTILLPLMLILSKTGIVFGGAKPVPVDPRYFKNPRRGMLWVALAGPVSNFILIVISFALLYALAFVAKWLPLFLVVLFYSWLRSSIFVNLVLALFNLFPIPPLDGGRIAVGILPAKLAFYYAKLERFGFFIVIALIYYNIPQKVIMPALEFVQEFM